MIILLINRISKIKCTFLKKETPYVGCLLSVVLSLSVDEFIDSSCGIVDIETLTHTNEQLIATLDEIQTIQKEGREKRVAAEAELGRIENELKTKLINMK